MRKQVKCVEAPDEPWALDRNLIRSARRRKTAHGWRTLFIAPPPSHLSAGGRRGRPSYQKNGRARNRQRPLAAIVCVRACHKTLKVLEALSAFRLPSFHRGLSARPFIAGSSRQTSALGTELARPSALLAVAVLRTVRHVLRIGRDVRSILVGLLHRRRRSSNHRVTLE